MSFCQILDARQKSLEVNLDSTIYGTFAEIGAGQEVSRHFFKAGGAAGTMAKTISAYDMTMSDIIYGKSKSGRYVSRDRLERMMEREYRQCVERLSDIRSDNTKFFAFANTVAAKSYSGKGECHGWLGITFQHAPKAKPSRAVVHIRMLDREAYQQQLTVGELGVNLIHACFFRNGSIKYFVSSLVENLSPDRLEIDLIHVEGPGFKDFDSRVLCLELVQRNFCRAALFDTDGTVQLTKDYLYKKNVLIQRGSWKPPTLLNISMIEDVSREFSRKLTQLGSSRDLVSLCEISMNRLLERGQVDNDDFLARVDLLAKLNKEVLITNIKTHEQLNLYIRTCTKENIAFVLGAHSLEELFKSNTDGDVSLLEFFGNLFCKNTTLYFFPSPEDDDPTQLIELENLRVTPEQMFLLLYLIESGKIVEMNHTNSEYPKIWTKKVLVSIQRNDGVWESMVPKVVSKEVKRKKLFGHKS
ncbi:MAG: TonB-dependent receptor [Bacteriovoracaceae bacterium]